MWETFTFATPSIGNSEFTITAVSGPSFLNVPDYPTLRVVDFQVVGEPIARDPGYFEVKPRTTFAFVENRFTASATM